MHDTGFHEIAERVWLARYSAWDVNVTLIGGASGLVVVDTQGSAAHARALVEDVRRIAAGPVVAAVNTHDHFDHSFGNGVIQESFGPLPIWATEAAAALTVPPAADGVDVTADVLATAVVPADHTFSSVATIDLGDRLVELAHPGRGHTAGDLVVRLPDADVVLAGDLVESAADPSVGADSFLSEWPMTLEVVVRMLTASSLVVPGHGEPVDRDFVLTQHAHLARLALDAAEAAQAARPVGPRTLPLV